MLQQVAATLHRLQHRVFRGRTVNGDPRHELGRQGERLAEKFLQQQGYRRIARNQRLYGGEIDLIMAAPRTDPTIIFIEVKTRTSDKIPGELALGTTKKRRLIQLTQRIAQRKKWLNRPLRIDVIVIVLPTPGRKPIIRHHQNAVTL